MIDIHCHLIYDTDDGCPDASSSKAMIDHMAQAGVTGIIATPHYRYHMFSYPQTKIDEAYRILREYASSKNVSLYLGCEYHVDHDIFKCLESGRVHSMADTPYVLTEYSYSVDLNQILNYTQELIMRGWKPIVAHAERCEVFQRNPRIIEEILDVGAQIQLNADSVLGFDGQGAKKTSRKLLDLGFADYIASDAHNMDDRAPHIKECFSFIQKKYGTTTAEILFIDNPKQLLQETPPDCGETLGG